jgi:hypothetical protein
MDASIATAEITMQTRTSESNLALRRQRLTLRLMAHQARTQTITAFTHFTRHQQATLRQLWAVPEAMRHRGPSPYVLSGLFRSPRARSELAALSVLCYRFNALPARRKTGGSRANLSMEVGEQLCLVMEVFRSCFPASALEFEQLLRLAIGLANGGEFTLSRCASCGCAILIDRQSAPRHSCSHCHTMDGVTEQLVPPSEWSAP